MKDLKVKRVAPAQLKPLLSWYTIWANKLEVDKFVAVYDKNENVLYINDSVPEEDAMKFAEYASFAGPYINEDEADGGLASVGDYICEKYGANAHGCILEAYKERQKTMRLSEAREKAEKLMPLIDTLRMDDVLSGEFDEYVAYRISEAARKSDRKTAHNMVGHGTECVFWLGYLTGAGLMPGDKQPERQ